MRRFQLFRSVSLVTLSFTVLCVLPISRPSAQKRPTGGESSSSGNASLSTLEQAVLQEINHARTHPAEYATFLDQLTPHFNGKVFTQPGGILLATEEGAGVVEEAARFLRSTGPIAPLEMSRGMCSGARVLVSDQGTSGCTGHKGGDGGYCEKRIERYGVWQVPVGENLSYGNDTARDRVIALIVDDGVANRGHRKRIFDPAFKVAGVACGVHKLGTMCAITFAGGFAERMSTTQTGETGKSPAAQQTSIEIKRF